ncbi:MAG TPA: oligosaccharide flippase family protein [Blastocatellia bacterium]
MKLVKNYLFLAGAEIVSKLVTFAAFAYLARAMGPEGFGQIEFAGAVLLCAGLLVDQGFSPYGAREIARAPKLTPAIVSEIVVARFMLAVAAYGVVVLIALVLDRPPVVTRLLLIYGLSLLVMPFLLQWVFQGHDRMQNVAVAQILRQSVFAAVVFALVRGASQIWLVAVAELAGVAVMAAYSIWAYRRVLGGAIEKRFLISKRLLREGVPIGLSQMFWMVKLFGATFILGLVAPASDVGYFAGALRILLALHTFVWLYYFNLLPSLSRAWQESAESFAGVIGRSMHGVAWVSLAAGILFAAAAPALMKIAYGAPFEQAGPVLQYLVAVCVLAALSGHYRFGLIAAGRQTAEMATSALGAVVAMIAIPVGYINSGPSGAAMGLCVAEAAVWLSSWLCGRHILGLNNHATYLTRPLLAAAVASGTSLLLPLSSTAPRLAVAGGIFVALALVSDGTVRDRLRQFRAAGKKLNPWQSKDVPEVTR